MLPMSESEFTRKIDRLSPTQRELIEQEIDNLLWDDTESGLEATALKHKVYTNYTDIIAELVAEVEVQTHDLPPWMFEFLEEVFNFCAVAVMEEEKSAEVLYQTALKHEKFLIWFFRLYLIESYRKDILHFQKTIKKFNHESIQTGDGSPVLTVLKNQIGNIMVSRRAAKKEFKKCYKGFVGVTQCRIIKPFFKKISIDLLIDFDKIDDLDTAKLETCYKQVKDCLVFCESTFPAIVGNGFVDSNLKRLGSFLPDIFAFILAVVGVVFFFRSQ